MTRSRACRMTFPILWISSLHDIGVVSITSKVHNLNFQHIMISHFSIQMMPWIYRGLKDLSDSSAFRHGSSQFVRVEKGGRDGGVVAMVAAIDGKGMLAMHHRTGRKCWLCDKDITDLTPASQSIAVLRYGAFLPSIPVSRRVGDYVHGAARIVNIILKRLCNEGSPSLTTSVRKHGFFSYLSFLYKKSW